MSGKKEDPLMPGLIIGAITLLVLGAMFGWAVRGYHDQRWGMAATEEVLR